MDFGVLAGIAGMVLILAGFIANIAHRLDAESACYLAMNMLGGILLLYYAIILKSAPFAVLQAAWAFAALIKLLHARKK